MSEEINEQPTPAPDAISETLTLVQEAQKKGVFNLSEVIKGRGYPTKDVTIYLDGESAFRLAEINNRLSEFIGEEEEAELNEEAVALSAKIRESALTFTMRGVSQKIVDKVMSDANAKYPNRESNIEDNNAWIRYYVAALVAQNIIRVTDATGNVDEHVFTPEELMDLREELSRDAWDVLADTMQKLTLASGYFDQLTDAGFLPRS
jgi:hypothetical protein